MTRQTSPRRRVAVLAMLAALMASALQSGATVTAQSTYGTLVGTIQDAGGSPVSNALVQIRGESGNPKSIRTDASGNYRFQFLSPGFYTLTVVSDGFREATRTDIQISITRTLTVEPPIRLSPAADPAVAATNGGAPDPAAGNANAGNGAANGGAVPGANGPGGNGSGGTQSESARGPLVTLFDPARGANFDRRYLLAVPVPGIRSFDEFALLVTGVSPAPETLSNVPGPGIGPGIGTAGQFSVNGQRPRSNNFQVDGSDNNDPDVGVRRQGFVALVPQSLESVEEFQISTLLWSAESGRNLGSQVNVVTRSGGDALHGQVYGFFNHDSLNARDPFDLTADGLPNALPVTSALTGEQAFLDGQPLFTTPGVGGESAYTRLQTGFVVGGPIVRGRTHYFGSFEYQRINASHETNFAVPTLDERGIVRSGGTGLIINRVVGTNESALTRPSSIVGSAVLSLFPFPNNPGGPYGANTYTEVLPADGRGVIGSIRIDHDVSLFGRENSLTGRFNFTDDVRTIPTVGGALFSTIGSNTSTQNVSFIMTTPISPTLFNLFRASFGRTSLGFDERRDPRLSPSGLRDEPFLLNAPLILNVTQPGENEFGGLVRVPPHFLSAGLDIERILGPLGQVAIAGYSPVGADVYTFPQARTSYTLQFADTVSYSYRAHSMKFGADIRPIRLDSDQQRNARAIATFNPVYYFEFDAGIRNASGSGGELRSDAGFILSGADLAALGAPSDYLQTLTTTGASSSISLRFTEWNAFFQDDWRVRPNLTLNLGVRYEYNSVPHEADGIIEQSFTDPVLSELPQLATILDGRTRIYDADRNNFGPRIGFAWDPFRNGTTVVRGGFGIYFDAILGAVVSQSRNVIPGYVSYNAGFVVDQRSTSPFALFPPIVASLVEPRTLNRLNDEVGLDGLLDLNRNSNFVDLSFVLPERGIQTPYAQQFGLTVEHQLLTDYAVSAAYVGVLSRHLLRANAPNGGSSVTPLIDSFEPSDIGGIYGTVPTVVSSTFGDFFNDARRYSTLGGFTLYESSGKSSYHGLQLEVKRRYAAGYMFQAGYTWSHAIDDASDVFDLAGGSAFPQNPYDVANERADAAFDARHRFSGSFLWDLPWGAGETGLAHALLSGWRVAGRAQAQTGHPFTVGSTLDLDFNGLLTDRPSNGGIVETGDDSAPISVGVNALDYDQFLNLGFYQGLATAARTSIGRNSFRGPRLVNVDLTVVKFIGLTERSDLELRAEVFNVFNRANYGLPVRFLEAPGFGRATSVVTPARTVQFALKLNF